MITPAPSINAGIATNKTELTPPPVKEESTKPAIAINGAMIPSLNSMNKRKKTICLPFSLIREKILPIKYLLTIGS